jgi:hypothetical protein
VAYFWVTFRIADGPGYNDRYQGLVDAMLAIGQGRWSDPTSFYLLEYSGDSAGLARKLSASLSSAKDMLLVRQLEQDDAVYFGKIAHTDVLLSFLPSAKKLA